MVVVIATLSGYVPWDGRNQSHMFDRGAKFSNLAAVGKNLFCDGHRCNSERSGNVVCAALTLNRGCGQPIQIRAHESAV